MEMLDMGDEPKIRKKEGGHARQLETPLHTKCVSFAHQCASIWITYECFGELEGGKEIYGVKNLSLL